jgi:hypothetical protein
LRGARAARRRSLTARSLNYFFGAVVPAGFFVSVLVSGFFGVVLLPVPVALVSVLEPVPVLEPVADEPVDDEPVDDEPVADEPVDVGSEPVGEVPVVLGALPVGDEPIDDGDVVLGVDEAGIDDEDVEGSVVLVVWVSGALAGSLLPPQARALATSRAAAKIETFMRDSPFWVVRAVSFRVGSRFCCPGRSFTVVGRSDGRAVQSTYLTQEWERNARVLVNRSILGVRAVARPLLLRGICPRVESSR